MTLEEIRSMTPERAVSDAEMCEALRTCLDAMQESLRTGRIEITSEGIKAGGEWSDELQRLMRTYAPYFARLALESLERPVPHV